MKTAVNLVGYARKIDPNGMLLILGFTSGICGISRHRDDTIYKSTSQFVTIGFHSDLDYFGTLRNNNEGFTLIFTEFHTGWFPPYLHVRSQISRKCYTFHLVTGFSITTFELQKELTILHSSVMCNMII